MEPLQKPTWREALAERFAGWGLLRLLLLNKWFAMAFLLIVLVSLLGAAGLPKIWRTTPPGFRPEVRVSLLDLAQSWSLRHRAEQLTAQGEVEEAVTAWQAAFANNLSDLRTLRGTLESVLALREVDRRVAGSAIWQAGWLMRLGQTNDADLTLVARVLDRCDLPEDVYAILSRREERLTEDQEGPYLRALFKLGMMTEFRRRWEAQAERYGADPRMELYQAAFRAGWGSPEEAEAGRLRLAEAVEHPDTRTTANRLAMLVAAKRDDPEAYREALVRLQDRRNDRVQDHVGYWRLLERIGRKDDALRLAHEYVVPPDNPFELVRLGEAYVNLGLDSDALELLRRYAPLMGNLDSTWSVAVWALFGDLLIQNKQWTELIEVSGRMRLMDRAKPLIQGLSHFFEGRARYGLGQQELAFVQFHEAAQYRFPTAQMGLQAAIAVARMSQYEIARELLSPLETDLAEVPEYWQTLFDVAYNMRSDETLLLKAATRAHELRPEDPVWSANYSAALLTTRQRPDEALRLTLEFMLVKPDALGARVNHALALAMNQRNDEAEQLLRSINVPALNPHESTVFHLVAFEVHLNRRDYDRAAASAEKIDPRFLFPSQLKWLKQAQAQLPERSQRTG